MKVYNKHHGNYPTDAVYIGRGSPWGNPFVIGKDGSRLEVIEKYKAYVENNHELINKIKIELKGKDLVCYCKPQACHGDYLINIANGTYKNRIIVAGSREFNDYPSLKKKLDHYLSNTNKSEVEIMCGMARGADLLGKKYAEENGISVKEFPADWETYGKSAGYIRNSEMAEYSTHLVLFWDGKSKGSKHMLDLAKQRNLNIRVVYV